MTDGKFYQPLQLCCKLKHLKVRCLPFLDNCTRISNFLSTGTVGCGQWSGNIWPWLSYNSSGCGFPAIPIYSMLLTDKRHPSEGSIEILGTKPGVNTTITSILHSLQFLSLHGNIIDVERYLSYMKTKINISSLHFRYLRESKSEKTVFQVGTETNKNISSYLKISASAGNCV